MALIKCPECGKESVSDSAISCPECGFAIKTYYERKAVQEQQKQQEIQLEEKAKEEYEKLKDELNRKICAVDNMPYPEKPTFKESVFNSKGGGSWLSYASIIALIATPFLAYVSFQGKSAVLTTLFLIVFVLLLVIWTPFWLMICYSDYKSSMVRFEDATKDWEGEKIKKKEQLNTEYEQYALNMAKYGTRNASTINMPMLNNKLKCPICGSTNVSRISTLNRGVSVATVGLASSKIGKQYECKKCKHKW